MSPSQCFLYCLWLITIHLPHLLVLGIPKINLIIPLGPSSCISKFLFLQEALQNQDSLQCYSFYCIFFFMTTVTLIITCLLSAILIKLHTYGRLGPFSFVCSQSCNNKEQNLFYRRKWKLLVAQLCPTLCHPTDYSMPSSSVHGILQSRYLSGLPFPSPRDLTDPGIEPCIIGRFFTIWVTSEAQCLLAKLNLGENTIKPNGRKHLYYHLVILLIISVICL